MLLDVHPQRRKRSRASSGPAAARAPPSVRRPPSSPSQRSPPAPIAASTRILAALPRFPETPRSPPPAPLWTRRAGSPRAAPATGGGGDDAGSSDTGDVQRLMRHAHRARALLLDRLAVVNLRRSHRCALAKELARLRKVLAATQAEVDASTRNIATMDRLVLHLQTISSIFDAGATQQQRAESSSGGREAAAVEGEGEAKEAADGDVECVTTSPSASVACPPKRLRDDFSEEAKRPPVVSENERINAQHDASS